MKLKNNPKESNDVDNNDDDDDDSYNRDKEIRITSNNSNKKVNKNKKTNEEKKMIEDDDYQNDDCYLHNHHLDEMNKSVVEKTNNQINEENVDVQIFNEEQNINDDNTGEKTRNRIEEEFFIQPTYSEDIVTDEMQLDESRTPILSHEESEEKQQKKQKKSNLKVPEQKNTFNVLQPTSLTEKEKKNQSMLEKYVQSREEDNNKINYEQEFTENMQKEKHHFHRVNDPFIALKQNAKHRDGNSTNKPMKWRRPYQNKKLNQIKRNRY
jgi:hypothetical protein